MRGFVLLAALLSMPGILSAQRGSFSPHFSGRSSGFQSGFNRATRFSGNGYYPLGFLDPLYADYASYAAPSELVPPVVVGQPAAATPEPSPVRSNPLMIELQGDKYVQVSGDGDSRVLMLESPTGVSRSDSATRRDNSVALLIFRDGHREEVSDYTISGGILYAAADYYSVGSWNRKIELSALNVPETIRTNQSHGVNFRLPGAPNEVIVGP